MRNQFDIQHIRNICGGGDTWFGLLYPPMDAQVAVDELCRYFLGADWYTCSGVTGGKQLNTEIVAAIESKYRGAKIKHKWLRHKKFDSSHILGLCELVDCGILAPPMDAQIALHELCQYFLGDDWYNSSGDPRPEHVNTAIVCAIEKQYKGAKLRRR